MPTDEQCTEAALALYRVRAVEKPPGPDGRKEVWHRASKGAELLSTVDGAGRLEEQELTLFQEVFYWHRGAGMKTGKLVGNEDVSSRGNILWDATPAPVRLNRCRSAFQSYPGNDAYLVHIRDAVAATLAGIEWNEERMVTTPARPGDSQATVLPGPKGPLQRLIGSFKKWGRKPE